MSPRAFRFSTRNAVEPIGCLELLSWLLAMARQVLLTSTGSPNRAECVQFVVDCFFADEKLFDGFRKESFCVSATREDEAVREGPTPQLGRTRIISTFALSAKRMSVCSSSRKR